MSAAGAGLASIGGIHFYYDRLIAFRFINQFLLKVVKRPRCGYVTIFESDALGSAANAGQIFQNKKRMLRIRFNKRLRYLMDIIEVDGKLTEIYIAIVKEMCIQYGVSLSVLDQEQ